MNHQVLSWSLNEPWMYDPPILLAVKPRQLGRMSLSWWIQIKTKKGMELIPWARAHTCPHWKRWIRSILLKDASQKTQAPKPSIWHFHCLRKRCCLFRADAARRLLSHSWQTWYQGIDITLYASQGGDTIYSVYLSTSSDYSYQVRSMISLVLSNLNTS